MANRAGRDKGVSLQLMQHTQKVQKEVVPRAHKLPPRLPHGAGPPHGPSRALSEPEPPLSEPEPSREMRDSNSDRLSSVLD